jgi:hypothetical protein
MPPACAFVSCANPPQCGHQRRVFPYRSARVCDALGNSRRRILNINRPGNCRLLQRIGAMRESRPWSTHLPNKHRLHPPRETAGFSRCYAAVFNSMSDLQQVIEAREIDIRCWHCGWIESRTVSWLNSKRHMSCPTCSSVIVLDTSEVRREITRQRRQLSTLHGQMVNLLDASPASSGCNHPTDSRVCVDIWISPWRIAIRTCSHRTRGARQFGD